MYKPDKGYWINVRTDSLSPEERAKVRGHLDFPDNIASYTYLYFYFQESARVVHIGTSNETYKHLDVFTEPKEFIHLFKLFSINKDLALIACVETVKRKLG